MDMLQLEEFSTYIIQCGRIFSGTRIQVNKYTGTKRGNMLDASKTIIITAGNARHVQMNTPKYRKLKVITCKRI